MVVSGKLVIQAIPATGCIPNWRPAGNIGEFVMSSPGCGGFQIGMAKIERPGTPHSFLRGSAVSFACGSFVLPMSPNWVFGNGVPSAKNIAKFERNPPKYGGPQCGTSQFRRPATFRSVPWDSAARLFFCGSFVFPDFPNWVLGKGCPGRKILPNSRGMRRNMAGSWGVG